MRIFISMMLLLILASSFSALAEVEAPEATVRANETQSAASTLLPAPEDLNGMDDTESSESFAVWFQEGFSLRLPKGWMSYAVGETDAAAGIRYTLSDGNPDHFLYIQFTPTEISNLPTLEKAIEANTALNKTGTLTFGGVDFITYIDANRGASCCSTLWNGELLTLIFTSQSDADYMLAASNLMETLTRL